MAKTAKIGKETVGKIGHGLMMMTWKPDPVPDDECFEAIKTSLDSVPPGCKMLINSGEFYGYNPREANLELIARFFEKYPSYADKAFLSVKGGVKPDSPMPDASPENLKRSLDVILGKLRGTKRLDLFECARVDKNVSIEDAIKTLSGFVAEDKFDYIGISEAAAETLRRANSVHPIAAVEIEVSPWSMESETKKVIATAKELGVTVVAYSPLGRGFLVGQFRSSNDLAPTDWRRGLSRFKDEIMKENFAIADALAAVARKKGITPAQLCISWVSSLGDHIVPIPGSSNAKRTAENTAAGNIDLTEEDIAAVNKVLADHPVTGDRYFGNDALAHVWG